MHVHAHLLSVCACACVQCRKACVRKRPSEGVVYGFAGLLLSSVIAFYAVHVMYTCSLHHIRMPSPKGIHETLQ